jgi:hypothetical protein
LHRQSLADQLDHSPPGERLFEKAQCAARLRTPSNGLFGKRRDENDWYAAASGDQAILKVKAAHARHLYVEDQAGAASTRGERRKSSADSNTKATKPSDRRRLCIAARTDAPSSTIETI